LLGIKEAEEFGVHNMVLRLPFFSVGKSLGIIYLFILDVQGRRQQMMGWWKGSSLGAEMGRSQGEQLEKKWSWL
jgi:hypothetical protein